MNPLKGIFLFLVLCTFVMSCNKDIVDKQSSDKHNEKKEVLNEKKSTTENKEDFKSADLKLYKIEKVEKNSVKQVAPNFSWTENGKSSSLDGLKGNVVLINLWATWCGPCIKEMPALSQLSEELKDKNFKMIGMNVFQQEGSKKVEDFLKTNPVAYTILDGNQEVVDAFGEATGKPIDAVPTTFIIGKDGKIAETIIGGRDKETFLKAINKYLN
ncbi:MAG: TlpA disulfide reductase family protein [Ignavibacteria bacterium]